MVYTPLCRALERERTMASHLQQTLDSEKNHSERQNGRDAAAIEDLVLQLDTERANLEDLNLALQREQVSKKDIEVEKSLLKEHLNQERTLNEEIKQDLDRIQVHSWNFMKIYCPKKTSCLMNFLKDRVSLLRLFDSP